MYENEASELKSIWDEAKGHIERGDFDKAIEIYKYIIIRYGDEPTAVEYANAYLADVYLTLEQNDPAEAHIKKALDYRPEKPGCGPVMLPSGSSCHAFPSTEVKTLSFLF